MSLQATFAANLKKLRLKRKMSQEALAHAAKLSTSYVSMLERQQRSPGLDTVESLAAVLGVPSRSLVS